MTFLVTFTFHIAHPLESYGPLGLYIGNKEDENFIFKTWTFYIGLNGHAPDESR